MGSQSRSLGSQSIAIYSDPALAQVAIGALKVTKALLFTVILLFGFPKHRYLQCSRSLGSQSSAIYSDPAPWVPKVSLFTVIPLLGSQSIAIYNDPAPAQVVIGALKVTKPLLFTVIPLLGFPKYRYLQ